MINKPLDKPLIPRHVAIIMDGNGRWASIQRKPRIVGHRKGVKVLQDVTKVFSDHGVDYLTLFAFSSENWHRPQSEVQLLISLLGETLKNELDNLHHQGICLRFIGDLVPFPKKLQKIMAKAQYLTKDNTNINVTIAINYGGRWDIKQSCEQVAELLKQGEISSSDITEELIDSRLSTNDLPEVDLLVRTGGEQRISNFFLWQCAYTELYFTDTYWPEFGESNIIECLKNFSKRQRRYGKTSEQIAIENEIIQ